MMLAPSNPPVGNWGQYYEIVCNRRNSYLAEIASPHVDFRGSFLDVGCGSMNDTRFALDQGFHRVEALDGSAHSPQYAGELAARYKSRFTFHHSTFQSFDFGVSRYDWIHSNFALPYHGQNGFAEFIEKLNQSLRDSGVISATFYGHRDGWNSLHRDFAFVTEETLRQMFSGLTILHLKEREYDGHFHNGEPKYWHYFSIVAKKSDNCL